MLKWANRSRWMRAAATIRNAGQTLHYTWFDYAEAGGTGTNVAAVTIAGADGAVAVVTPTSPCRAQWTTRPCSGNGTAHIIVAATDDGSPQLTSYRRIILNVNEPARRPLPTNNCGYIGR